MHLARGQQPIVIVFTELKAGYVG